MSQLVSDQPASPQGRVRVLAEVRDTSRQSDVAGRDADHRGLRRRLHGRDPELDAAMSSMQEAVGQRRSTTIVVRGEPGVGTTAFCEALADEAHGHGFVVRAGTCRSERDIRFGGLLQVFTMTAPGADGSDGDRHTDTPADDGRRWQDVVGDVSSVTAVQPLLVWLDDAQWLETASVSVLLLLARRLASQPVVWLLGAKAGIAVGVDEILQNARRCMTAYDILLDPLTPEAVLAMAADIEGREPGDQVKAWLAGAGGNSSIATVLLESLQEPTLRRGSDQLPVRFVERVIALVQRWSGHDTATSLLQTGALLDWSFDLDEVATALSVPPGDLARPLRYAVACGLVSDNGTRIRFRQRLVREALYQGLEPSVRDLLHRDAARRLALDRRPLTDVAPHLVATAEVGDERVLAVVARTAEDLLRAEPGRTADLLGSALRVAGDDQPWRTRLGRMRVDALVAAGRATEALVFGSSLLPTVSHGADMSSVMLSMSTALWLLDRRRELASLVKLASQEAMGIDGVQAQLRSTRALVLAATDDFETSRARCSAALEAARRVGDSSAEATALAAMGQASASVGRDTEAAEHFAARTRILGSVSADEVVARTLLGEVGIPERLIARARSEIEDCRSQEQPLRLAAARGIEHLAKGHLAAAERDSSTAVALIGNAAPGDACCAGIYVAASVAILQGDLGRARRLLSLARPLGDDSREPGLLRYTAALLADMTGDHSAAASSLDDEVLTQLTVRNGWNRDWMVDAVRIGVTAGDIELAERAAAVAHEYQELNPSSPLAAGWSLQADGLVAGDVELVGRSVEAHSQSARPLVIAAAQEDQGRLLLAAGRETQARAALTAALRRYQAAGATSASERILRQLGPQVSRVGPNPSPRSARGWASLTPAQARVAWLVAQGNANKQVAHELSVSPHTVSNHLRAAFRKLGVSSRVQLTRVVLGAS